MSRIDAVFNAAQQVLDHRRTDGCCQQVDGPALSQPDGGTLQPPFRLLLRPKDQRRFGEDFGKSPGSAALLGIEGFGQIILAPLKGPHAHPHGGLQ